MTKLKFRPLSDRVLIKADDAEDVSRGGIIIPDNAKEKPDSGEVVAVGPGKPEWPLTVKVGDTVLYGKHSGTQITVQENEYVILRESEVLAIT